MAKKTSVRKVSRKSTKKEHTAPAPAPASAPAPAVETPVVPESVTEVASWEVTWNNIVELQKTMTKTMKELNSSVKTLRKQWTKELKEQSKHRKKKTNNGKKRAPSGFAKPTRISEALCSFLGKPNGTEMARTEVTKFLTTYVRENNLQDPTNKRIIVPDSKLQKLLSVKSGDSLTYFNLQRYMKPHFPKSASATASATA
jgi:upstream activation factor subunit UAF30